MLPNSASPVLVAQCLRLRDKRASDKCDDGQNNCDFMEHNHRCLFENAIISILTNLLMAHPAADPQVPSTRTNKRKFVMSREDGCVGVAQTT